MALINQVIEEAKKQKATNTTKVNKMTPTGGLANKVKTSVPKTVAPVAPKVSAPKSSGVTNVLNKVKESKPLANAQNGVSNINKIVESISQPKVTQDRSKKAGTGILTANSRSAVEEKKNNIFATLRPKEEFDQEYNSINKQLNDIYRARSIGAVVNYDTTKLENRKAELDEERKLQNERAEKYTIPEFEKKYAEAMSNGNIDTALDYAGILETYDDRDFINTTVKADLERLDADEKKIVHDLTERQASYEEIEHHLNNRGYDYDRAKDILNALNKNAFERFVSTGFNSAVHGFNSMTIGFYDTFVKDTVPELSKDLLNKKAEIARFSGNEELAKQYESGAEVAQKYADSFDATDPNNAAMVIKNGTERAMQLDSYAQSPTMKLALGVDQSIANMTPQIVTGTGLYGMGAQVYADTFYNDRAEGYDIQTSALHSALTAANEVAWENVWKVLPVDENALGQQIAKVFDSDIGKAAMVEMANPSSEFVEEFGTSITGHYIDNWILKKNDPLNLEDAVKDGMMGYVQAALMRLPVDVAKTTMNEITTTRRANYEKSIIERTNEIASMPENQNNETVQDLARFINVVGQARLEDFYQKSILSRAITVESDEVSVPSSKELLGLFEQGMIPAEDNYQREVQKNALELATASQKMLDDAGINTTLFDYMSTDSDTRRELSRLAAEGLDINGTEFIQNKNADYRNAMIEIAENNIKGKDGSSAMKTADWLSMDDAQREEARIAAKSVGKDSSIDVFSMARLEPGMDGYLATKNGSTQLVASTDQGIVLSMDKIADYDSNKFWGVIDGIAKDIGTKEEYTDEERDEIKKRLTPIFKDAGQNATIITTAVHELTHYIEKSKYLWNALRSQIEAEMGSGRYKEALKRIDTVYKLLGVKNANAESELVAHYIQENIANIGFLNRISKYNNSSFYRLYNNLKTSLTGDSKAKMETTFMDALRFANQQNVGELGLQYAVNTNSLRDNRSILDTNYSLKEIDITHKNGDYIEGLDYSIDQFLKKFKDSDNQTQLWLGKINQELVDRVKTETGFDLSGKSLVLTSDNADHLEKHDAMNYKAHGDPAPIDSTVLYHLADILNNADSIEYYKEGQQDRIKFETDTEQNYYYRVIELIPKHNKNSVLVTMYTVKKGGSQVPGAANAASNNLTSATNSGNGLSYAPSNPTLSNDDGNVNQDSVGLDGNEKVQYSLAIEPKTLEFLDNQDHVKVYRAMAMIDGKLYPPMATKVKNAETGKYELQEPTEIGKWYQADERPDLIDPKTGKYKLKKDEGTDVNAAYNPYWHTSLSVLNDQFTSAYKRPNLVVVEGEVPSSELSSGYRAQYAKDPVGKTEWHSGTVSSDLKKAGKNAREVILSRWFRPTRVLSNAEVAKGISDMVTGTGVEIPFNVVTPSVRAELEKLGVAIGDSRGLREVLSKDVQYSAGLESAEAQDTLENKIYNSMSMSEARRMLEKTWNQYKDDYDEKTLDEFLKNDPDFAAEQMELLIENTFNLQDDYVNSNEDILNGEYSISDIVKAYLDGKLKNENKSFKLKDIEFVDVRRIS